MESVFYTLKMLAIAAFDETMKGEEDAEARNIFVEEIMGAKTLESLIYPEVSIFTNAGFLLYQRILADKVHDHIIKA